MSFENLGEAISVTTNLGHVGRKSRLLPVTTTMEWRVTTHSHWGKLLWLGRVERRPQVKLKSKK